MYKTFLTKVLAVSISVFLRKFVVVHYEQIQSLSYSGLNIFLIFKKTVVSSFSKAMHIPLDYFSLSGMFSLFPSDLRCCGVRPYPVKAASTQPFDF